MRKMGSIQRTMTLKTKNIGPPVDPERHPTLE